MSIFNQFGIDKDKEENGLPIEYAPNKDGTIPAFRIKRMGPSNQKYQKAMEDRWKPYRRQIEQKTLDIATINRISREIFVDTVLIGWENIQNRNGEVIPFNRQEAIKLFTELPELENDLTTKASDFALFVESSREDDSGN